MSSVSSALRDLCAEIWKRAEPPVIEIIVHLLVTALSIVSISLIEHLLMWLGLDGKIMPFTHISLSEWMFYLEVIASTLIIVVGIIKAVVTLVREP